MSQGSGDGHTLIEASSEGQLANSETSVIYIFLTDVKIGRNDKFISQGSSQKNHHSSGAPAIPHQKVAGSTPSEYRPVVSAAALLEEFLQLLMLGATNGLGKTRWE